jgi:hypothetical protein
MAIQKPLVIGSGTTAQFPSVVGDSLEIDGAVLAKNTTNSLTAFQVQNAAGTVVLDVDTSNARVGVGTAAPLAALDLASGQLAIPDGTVVGTVVTPALVFRDDLNTGLFSPGNDIVGVAVNGTEVARMQQTGAGLTPALLIGTIAPIGAISGSGNISVDSSDPSATSGVVMLAHGPSGTAIQESYRGGQFAGVRTLGTKTSPLQVLTDAGLWNAIGAGYTSAAGYNYGALITFKAEQAYTASASGGRIEFHTTLNGTDGIATLGGSTTERMRITNAGNVGIGTSTPGAKLEVANSDALVYGLTVGRGGGAVSGNTAVGSGALTANTASGTANTAVGGSALATNTAGDQLTAVGFNALTSVTGTANTAVGAGCGQNITSGVSNTGVGAFALSGLSAATTGSNNTALGYVALSANTASENTAVGAAALGANTTGTGHVAVGYNALGSTATSADCTAVGHSALAVATGASNTAVGGLALTATTTGNSNVAVGKSALAANIVGSSNVAIGTSALASMDASGSVAVGSLALTLSTVATNVAVGDLAASSLTTGARTTVLGYRALISATTASDNTAIGSGALLLATGADNTAVGSGAINSLTTGSGNIGIGVGVLTAATTGVDNVAVGNSALASQVSGGENVGVGTLALANNTANSNTAIGNQAAQSNTSGTLIVAVGASALKANTTAADSTAVGANALASSTGASNTALGSGAGSTVTSGSNLTLIGFNAQPTAVTATNQITLGNASVTHLRVGTASLTAPNPGLCFANLTSTPSMKIGHSANSAAAPFVSFYITGGNGTGAAITQAAGGGFAVLYSNGSDYRLKQDVESLDTADALARVESLRPVRFHYTMQADGPLIEGFIAHEVQAVVPQAVTHSKDAVDVEGNPTYQGFDQAHLVPVLTAACKQLAAQAAAATARAIEAERRLDALEAALAALQNP